MLSSMVRALLARYSDHPAVSEGGLPRPESVTGIHISHRWQGRLVLILFRPQDRSPWLVVKAGRHPEHLAGLEREAANLAALGHRPEFSGLVPEQVGRLDLPGLSASVQTGVPGVTLTSLLRRRILQRPGAWARDHEQVQWWIDALGRWEPSPTPALVDVADGFERLSEAVGDVDERSRRWLDRERVRAREIGTIEVPMVRMHGDLGPSNVLVSHDHARLVDWDGDLEPRVPVADVAIFLHHYVRAVPLPSGRMPTREEVIERAFAADDALGRLTRRSWHRAMSGYGVDGSVADPLLLATLGMLAAGVGGHAHAAGTSEMWSSSARHLVRQLADGAHSWPATR